MIRGLLIPTAIVAAFSFGALTLMATAPELQPDTPEPIAVTVRVQEVNPTDLRLKIHSQGSVMPSTESQLIPEVSGRVSWVSPSLVAGGYFDKGDVLVRIEPQDYRNSKDRARAGLVRAEAEQEHAKFEYQRMVSLAERQLASKSQLEDALRKLRVADATLTDARAGLSQARQELGRTELRAPFAGLVRNETVDIGQFVSRGSSIGSIYASDRVEVRLPISDRQLAFLDLPIGHQGAIAESEQAPVILSAEYAGRNIRWAGQIVRTEASIDTTSRMVYLVAQVNAEEQEAPLNVGLFVEAEIQGRHASDIVVLPRTALRNGNQVLIVDDNNRLRYRDIKTLRLYQDDVLIENGLIAGELVCVSPIQTAIDGMGVTPIFDPAADRAATIEPSPLETSVPIETIEVSPEKQS
ncbi:MAG: efflux RND transporter periplasmic adaptor subunit [Pseudomonadales bacterium]